MDDDEMQALDIRDFEIEGRLEAFARARLSPDPAGVARTRARVMREARLQFEAARTAPTVASPVALGAGRPLARRIAVPLLAASLWAGVLVGSVAAAQAGGPLYPTRLWIEATTLPAGGAERTTAELGRLDARLADAMGAAARGDGNAVVAALVAYRQIADEAIAGALGDPALEARVTAALERHVDVLTAVGASLDAKGNTTAATAVETAIERAIEHNAAVVAGLGNSNGGGSSGETGSGSGSGAAGAGTTNGNGQAGGDKTGNDQTGSKTGGNGTATSGATGGNGQTGNGQDGTSRPSKDPKPTPTAPVTAPEPSAARPAPTPDHAPRGQNP